VGPSLLLDPTATVGPSPREPGLGRKPPHPALPAVGQSRPDWQRSRSGRETYRLVPVEPSVLAAFQRRDPDAVREMYRAYGRLVYAVTHRVLGRADLAEEATQQTFIQAWQAADRLDVDRDPAPWLATIARRAAIDIHRRESRRAATPLDSVATDDPAVVTLPPDLGSLDAVWQVRRAIEALPPEEATIARMQHLDGLTHSEIAAKLGLAIGTVKSRSHRAHGRLANLLGHLREPVR
jgi:RNA polymerase sigma factor (sigma-70 family)